MEIKTAGELLTAGAEGLGWGKEDCMPIDCKHIKLLVAAMVSENLKVAIADLL